MRGNEFEGTRVARVVGEIEVGFVHDDQRGGRHGLHEGGEFIAGDDGAGGIVGVADVGDAGFGGAGRGHFREIVAMVGGERDQHGVGMQDAGVVQHGFESGGGGYDVARGVEKGVVGGAENFSRAAAEDDVFGLQV